MMAATLTYTVQADDGTVGERLARRLKVAESGCHEWTGCVNARGYGQIHRGRRTTGMALTHRIAWELANGPIPDGLHVLHHCDNPPCCNVEHLFLGTAADNAADKVAKGRQTTNGNEKKTHCPAGHPYIEVNTYVNPAGHRQCRTCARSSWRNRDRRRRLAALEMLAAIRDSSKAEAL